MDFKKSAILCWMWVALSLTSTARFVYDVASHDAKPGGVWFYVYAAIAALSITCAAHWVGRLVRGGK
jgi:hypothetical protein